MATHRGPSDWGGAGGGGGDGGGDGEDPCDRSTDYDAIISDLGPLTPPQRSRLVNKYRKKMVRELYITPGLSMNALARKAGLAASIAVFHLDRLKEVDLVIIEDGVIGRGRVCLLKQDDHLWENPKTRVLFSMERRRELAHFLAKNQGTTTEDISDGLDWTQRAARYHLKIFEDHGLIERFRLGNAYEIYAEPALQEWSSELGGRLDGACVGERGEG